MPSGTEKKSLMEKAIRWRNALDVKLSVSGASLESHQNFKRMFKRSICDKYEVGSRT